MEIVKMIKTTFNRSHYYLNLNSKFYLKNPQNPERNFKQNTQKLKTLCNQILVTAQNYIEMLRRMTRLKIIHSSR